MLWITLAWRGVVVKITPHMYVFLPWLWVYSICSTISVPYPVQCTIPLLHVLPNFYSVVVFRVQSTLLQVVQWGVLFHLHRPSISLCDDIVGFLRKGLSIFNFIVACGISLHHIWIGKRVSVLDSPATKWYFHVLMDHSTAFTRWICGGHQLVFNIFLSVVFIEASWFLVIYPMDLSGIPLVWCRLPVYVWRT